MVRRPEVFLMDEPLSNLDAKLRNQMRVEIRELQRDLGVTTIYVTHDQVEAMTMGDRIVVMRGGYLQQQGPPEELFNNPANLFIATFLGTPSMNLFEVDVARDDDGVFVVIGDQRLRVPQQWPELGGYVGKTLAVGLRPQDVVERFDGAEQDTVLRAHVRLVETLGFEKLVYADLPGRPVVSDQVREVAADTDAALADSLELAEGAGQVPVIARLGADAHVDVGTLAEFSVRTHRMHLFDIETGRALDRTPTPTPTSAHGEAR
jgi:multiple sugar transport system ATP-binding protein